MIKKVKKWLGIEGVKLELILPETIKAKDQKVDGIIRLYSMHEQNVAHIRVSMVERYTRGRKKEKMIDEYKLGEIYLERSLTIPSEKKLDIAFSLPFELSMSEMDELGHSNILMGGLVKIAKRLEGVKSEYFIQAEAKVVGTGLNPFDKQYLKLE